MMSAGAHASGFISQVASTPPSAIPGLILTGYTEYLWSYKPNSWVAKIASIFRVLALLVVLPVVFLGALVRKHVKYSSVHEVICMIVPGYRFLWDCSNVRYCRGREGLYKWQGSSSFHRRGSCDTHQLRKRIRLSGVRS